MSGKDKPKSSVIYFCHNCDDLRVEGIEAMKKHLKEVHGIDTETEQFEKRLIAHLDGRDYYTSTYAWEGGGVKFESSECHERDDDDMMRWI